MSPATSLTQMGARELLTTAEMSIRVAAQLGIPRLNLHGTALDSRGLPIRPVEVITGDMWLKAEDTLGRIAELGQREGVIFCLENLNTAVDHPGTPVAKAVETLALVVAVDSPHLRLMLDIYHAQIGEGNLVDVINKCAPYIGEVQVADGDGRVAASRAVSRWITRHVSEQISCPDQCPTTWGFLPAGLHRAGPRRPPRGPR
jgi:hydroxypyruvate isomerase